MDFPTREEKQRTPAEVEGMSVRQQREQMRQARRREELEQRRVEHRPTPISLCLKAPAPTQPGAPPPPPGGSPRPLQPALKTRCSHFAPPGAETARLEQEVEEARAEAADSW